MSDATIHNDRNDLTGGHGAIGADALHKPNAVNIPGVAQSLTGLFVAVD